MKGRETEFYFQDTCTKKKGMVIPSSDTNVDEVEADGSLQLTGQPI